MTFRRELRDVGDFRDVDLALYRPRYIHGQHQVSHLAERQVPLVAPGMCQHFLEPRFGPCRGLKSSNVVYLPPLTRQGGQLLH